MSNNNFGEYLRNIRKKRGLTVLKLSDLSGVSQGFLTNIENGKRKKPSPDILKKLAQPLEVSYGSLMEEAGYSKDEELKRIFFELQNSNQKHELLNNKDINSKPIDIYWLLKAQISVSMNGHILSSLDRQRTLIMLDILFPEYINKTD